MNVEAKAVRPGSAGNTKTGSGQTDRPDPVSSSADQGRFMSQLVGVLDTKLGNSRTGTSVMPVFSGL